MVVVVVAVPAAVDRVAAVPAAAVAVAPVGLLVVAAVAKVALAAVAVPAVTAAWEPKVASVAWVQAQWKLSRLVASPLPAQISWPPVVTEVTAKQLVILGNPASRVVADPVVASAPAAEPVVVQEEQAARAVRAAKVRPAAAVAVAQAARSNYSDRLLISQTSIS